MKILAVLGSRPEVIKLSPVLTALKAYPKIQVVVVNTQQQLDLSDSFVKQFHIAPHYNLGIMVKNQSLNHIVSKCVGALDKVLVKEKPDLVVVHGDTTTAVSGALASFNRGVPVAHCEGGLRSGNRLSPYPEEMNRQLISRLAEYHFCPTDLNVTNLLDEGIELHKCYVTSNTAIDVVKAVKIDAAFQKQARKWYRKKLITLTLHRQENESKIDEYLQDITLFLIQHPTVGCVWPTHPKPYVVEAAKRLMKTYDKQYIKIIEPLPYRQFISLVAMSDLVCSDAGGLQEEITVLKRPLMVLRQETERSEVLGLDFVKLVPDNLFETLQYWYERKARYRFSNCSVFGNGFAGPKIAKIISRLGKC